ncbi:helix-turn-helix domain-containing protein [Paenibacillus koleovorans]|uniref:helix-turn-helix domain-containing protein n=1 Tax=Paenibacillus koleovorans TaxID=121608 RepID=UPI001FEB38A0|nr:helix-turn-helix transcriptional regulator [Paenibacillus koleovorans]
MRELVVVDRLDPSFVMKEFAERYQFTGREYEMLLLLVVNGLSNRDIAEQCFISEKTVQNHLANMMKKLGTRSTRQFYALVCHHLLQVR